jgi:hypothetical protein
MGMEETARRRWFGGLMLAGAVAMLFAGETFLKGKLLGSAFWIYWLVCFFLTGVAMLVALRDARAMLQRTGREQRDLLESTLKDIQKDAQARRNSPRSSGRNNRG